MTQANPPTITSDYPPGTLDHASKLKSDFDSVYEYLLDVGSAPSKPPGSQSSDIIEGVVKDGLKQCLKEIKASKGFRKKVRKAVLRIMRQESALNHPSEGKTIERLEKIFNSLYWGFDDLYTKLQSLQEVDQEGSEYSDLNSETHQKHQYIPEVNGYGPISELVEQVRNWPNDLRAERHRSDTAPHRLQYRASGQAREKHVADSRRSLQPQDSGSFDYSLQQGRYLYKIEANAKIYEPSILAHLQAMNHEELIAVVSSAINRVKDQGYPTIAIHSISKPVVMRNGYFRVYLHSETPFEPPALGLFKDPNMEYREFFQTTPTWTKFIELATIDTQPYKVLVKGLRSKRVRLNTKEDKSRAVEELIINNGAAIKSLSLGAFADIRYWTEATVDPADYSVLILFNSIAQANDVLDHGLYWDGMHHICVMQCADQLLHRCSNCQMYGHDVTCCDHYKCCERCGLNHGYELCTADARCCAVCAGAHRTDSEGCPVRQAVQVQIDHLRFSYISGAPPKPTEAPPRMPRQHRMFSPPRISHNSPLSRSTFNQDFGVREKPQNSNRARIILQEINDYKAELRDKQADKISFECDTDENDNVMKKVSELHSQANALQAAAQRPRPQHSPDQANQGQRGRRNNGISYRNTSHSRSTKPMHQNAKKRSAPRHFMSGGLLDGRNKRQRTGHNSQSIQKP